MKGSFLILACFIAGLMVGYFGILPASLHTVDFTRYTLAALLFCIGLGIGYDKKLIATLRRSKPKILLVPIATIIGTLLGTAFISLFIPEHNAFECMAVGSGFGYYSLSSIIIKDICGSELSTIALASNIIREMTALLIAPFLVMYFGKLAPIAAGGATTMDTTLPIITKFSGPEFVFIAIFHGLTLDLCVPFLVSFLANMANIVSQ